MKKRKLSPYQQKLLDPRWQKKRLEILQRDDWRCQRCFDSESTLHVHHRYYEHQYEPWDYSSDALVTLCADCHELETNRRPLYEQLLLQNLREIGLAYDQVAELAYSFESWPRETDYTFTISAIAWEISNESMRNNIAERYADTIAQPRRVTNHRQAPGGQ